MKNSKLSKKNSGVPEKNVKQTQEQYKKCFDKLAGVKQKPYPIPEEDSFIPPDDDSAEVNYKTKKNKS